MKKLVVVCVFLLAVAETGLARYNPKYDDYVTREDMMGFVKEAVAYAKIYGKRDALNEFKDKEGLFNRGELYIYAYDFNCVVLSHGSNPRLIGKDLSLLEDIRGTKIIKKMVEKIRRRGKGWLKFYWFHPKTKRITPKLGYFERIDSGWWLGSGIYYNEEQ